jgi:caffeoyl-CoA O-methyltransferase
MMKTPKLLRLILILLLLGTGYLYNLPSLKSKVKKTSADLDKRVKKFLKEHRSSWDRWNVSEYDGKFLYDMIIKNNYRRVLEIGTSTGRSAIWMGWALSKTGGKLITIEIDEDTCRRAMRNFRVAGLSDYIHAKLGDAHKLVHELKGPFEWNLKYLQAVEPKIRSGGCFAAHNIASHDYPFSAMRKFLAYLEKRKDLKTTYNRKSSAGISVSCK